MDLVSSAWPKHIKGHLSRMYLFYRDVGLLILAYGSSEPLRHLIAGVKLKEQAQSEISERNS